METHLRILSEMNKQLSVLKESDLNHIKQNYSSWHGSTVFMEGTLFHWHLNCFMGSEIQALERKDENRFGGS